MKRKDMWLKVLVLFLALVVAALLGWVALGLAQVEKNGGYQIMTVPDSYAHSEESEAEKRLVLLEDGRLVSESEAARLEAGVPETTAPQKKPVIKLENEKRPVTLLFAGDVLLSDHVLNAYDKAGGIQGVLDEGIRKQIRGADIFMVNQEFPFSSRGAAVADKQYTFRLPPSRVNLLKEMGIDVVTLANNHILDFGTDPLVDSGTTLDVAGIDYVGAGENLERAKKLLLRRVNGTTIGYLGASRVYMDASWAATAGRPGVFSTYDPRDLVAEIEAAREVCDYLVVYVHWGIERDTKPQEYQRTLAMNYIDAGADLVVGSHPHVLQGVEYYNGKPILYSLGNFVFGSSIPSTALLKVELSEERHGGSTISLIPCTSSAGYTSLVTEEDKVKQFYQRMEELSFDVNVGDNGVVTPK
ncbi:MAG: CapA family protein [Hungatella hathewayi]|nr:CapA family protein [Hungatella hathewayi]